MKIAIDGHTLEVENWSGKEQYLINLLQSLSEEPKEHLYYLYLRKSIDKPGWLEQSPNFIIRQKNLPTPIWHFWFLTDMARNKIDRLFAPCAYLISSLSLFVPSVIVIHDLTAFLKISRSTHKISLRIKEWLFTYFSCIRAKNIISVSENTKRDIIKIFKIRPEKITVIYLGHRFQIKEKPEQLHIEPIILSVGTIEPRKNIPTIVKVLECLVSDYPQIPWRLKIIGKIGWKSEGIMENLNKLKNAKEIEILGYVTNEELLLIYQQSLCLLYPSIYEGFGLPPLEAMSLGCPVIIADNSSLPEVIGSAGFKTNCFDYRKMEQLVYNLWQDSVLRKKCELAGYEQAKKFNWKKTAEQTIAVLSS